MPIARLIAEEEQLSSLLDPFGNRLAACNVEIAYDGGDFAEVTTQAGSLGALDQACKEFFRDADVLVTEHSPVVPGLFISDMDSTMIGQECIDELADYAGIKPQIAEITGRAMQGELDFEAALRERVTLLKGLEEGAIDRCLAERIRPIPGARTLVQTLKSHGCRCVLVTGGFHHFADPVAAQLGFDHVVGNRLEVSSGRLTGGLVGTITDSSVKRATLQAELAGLGEDAVALATGDGANDIPMLQAADYGVAYRAKPKAKQAANGWIDRGDLTAVLRLLGIPESDWVVG